MRTMNELRCRSREFQIADQAGPKRIAVLRVTRLTIRDFDAAIDRRCSIRDRSPWRRIDVRDYARSSHVLCVRSDIAMGLRSLCLKFPHTFNEAVTRGIVARSLLKCFHLLPAGSEVDMQIPTAPTQRTGRGEGDNGHGSCHQQGVRKFAAGIPNATSSPRGFSVNRNPIISSSATTSAGSKGGLQGNSARECRFFCNAAKFAKWPLLTSNGISAGFSVLVSLE